MIQHSSQSNWTSLCTQHTLRCSINSSHAWDLPPQSPQSPVLIPAQDAKHALSYTLPSSPHTGPFLIASPFWHTVIHVFVPCWSLLPATGPHAVQIMSRAHISQHFILYQVYCQRGFMAKHSMGHACKWPIG